MLAIDIETHDPYLHEFGSFIREATLLGVGVYDGVKAEYLTPKDRDKITNILTSNEPKVFHNSLYDLWGLDRSKFDVGGRIHDTMCREYLLDMYAGKFGSGYSLDASCIRRGVEGKNYTDTVDAWWKEHGGKGRAIEHLIEMPIEIVGKYCKQDVIATYNLYNKQQPLLEQEDLLQAYNVETEMIPLTIQAKINGIRIDRKRRREISDKMGQELEDGMKELQQRYPFFDSLNASSQLAKIWEIESIPITRLTPAGKPSFSGDALEECKHPIGQKIHRLRSIDKCLGTFVDAYVDMVCDDGRIHPTYAQFLRDDSGTITGRMSSIKPNLTQVPADSRTFGPEVRSIFIPDEGCILGAFDYSQIEYMVMMHFAAEEKYNRSFSPQAKNILFDLIARLNKEKIDFHKMVGDLMGLPEEHDGRKVAKMINFGKTYGMGIKGLCERFGLTITQGKYFMTNYNRAVPFVEPLLQAIQNVGKIDGYVTTIDGRRQRRSPDGRDYTLINYLCQGGAACIFKKGLLDAYKAGVFNVLKIHLYVHDEVVVSIPMSREGLQAAQMLVSCMENAYKLNVRIRVDTEIGPNWADCNKDNWNEFVKCYS